MNALPVWMSGVNKTSGLLMESPCESQETCMGNSAYRVLFRENWHE